MSNPLFVSERPKPQIRKWGPGSRKWVLKP